MIGPPVSTARIPRIELGLVAGTPEALRLGLPHRDVTARVRADTRIRHDAVGRLRARVGVELVGAEAHEEDLVQPRAVADGAAHRIERIDLDGRLATQHVGGTDDLEKTDVHQARLSDGDQVLLCSDGLTKMIDDAAIAAILQRPGTAAEACQALIDAALDKGGTDNVTVVLARYRIPSA